MTTMPTARTCATCLHLDRRCGCCGLTGEARQTDMAACAEHTDGKMDSERKPNARLERQEESR
jgi:hypothetical protein